MNTLCQKLSLFEDFKGLLSDGGETCAARFTQVTTTREESKDITILTDEGDRVTISADSKSTARYATYGGLVRGNGISARIQGQSLETAGSGEYTVSIEGDLSETEMEDIQKALKTIDDIIRHALSGDRETILAMAEDVTNLDSISAFEAGMEWQKQVVVEQASFVTTTKLQEPAVDSASGNLSGMEPPEPAADRVMDVVKQTEVDPARFRKPLTRHLSRFFDGFESENHGRPRHLERGRRMRAELFDRLKQAHHNRLEEQDPEGAEPAIEDPQGEKDCRVTPEVPFGGFARGMRGYKTQQAAANP